MALDQIYNMLEGQITGALAGRYAAVQGLVEAPLHTAMAINLVVVGYAIMGGVSNEPFGNYLSTRSEEHTSELQSLMRISYAVFCLKKKTHAVPTTQNHTTRSKISI